MDTSDDHVYNEIRNSAYETLGPSNSSNKAEKQKQNKDERVRIRRTRILFALIGVLIGGVIAGAVVYFILRLEMNKTHDWSSWSSCSVTCGQGNQYKIKQLDGDHFKTKTCSMKPCPADDVFLHIKFNRSSLHSNIFISDNNKVISRHNTPETSNNGTGDQRFKNYKGVAADRCVQDNTVIYYTVKYQYKITSKLVDRDLVLELGVGERDQIDNHHYVGGTDVNGWSFHIANCITYDKICLSAEHKSTIEYNSEFSHNTAGSRIHGNFDVLIDRIKDTFTLIENNKVRYTFHNVISDVNLCPVFGVYARNKAEIKLQIINFYNLTNLPPLFV